MDKQTLEMLIDNFTPVVKKIIESNFRFYGIDKTIQWRFVPTGNPSILATCDRKTNVITINIDALDTYYRNNNLVEAEYFIIHEIRHIYQHLQIEKYKSGQETDIDKSFIEKWIYEGEHYEKALNDNNEENPKYFLQDCELDAYAFAYAVMKYKYQNVNVYVPPVYGQEFIDIVDDWINVFKEEKL